MFFPSTRPSRTLVAVVVCVGAIAALVIGIRPVPAKPKAAPPPLCQLLNPQPAEPLQLNTVPLTTPQGDFTKSVAMEKEVFRCSGPGSPQVIRDVETFIEVLERRDSNIMAVLPKRVQQVACEKAYSANTGTVKCKRQAIQLEGQIPNPLVACVPLAASAQPAAPVRMNTVVVGGNKLVKTLKVEKEVWKCGSSTTLADVYLFTELIENPGNLFGAAPTIAVFGIVCRKSVTQGTLTKCSEIAVGTLP